jgi:hypothetical protein
LRNARRHQYSSLRRAKIPVSVIPVSIAVTGFAGSNFPVTAIADPHFSVTVTGACLSIGDTDTGFGKARLFPVSITVGEFCLAFGPESGDFSQV